MTRIRLRVRRVLRDLLLAVLDHLDPSNPLAELPLRLVRLAHHDYRNARLKRVAWLDQETASQMKLLAPSAAGLSAGPSIAGHQWVESISVPAVHAYLFQGASVSAYSSTLSLGSRLVLERPSGTETTRVDLSGGHLLAHRNRSALVDAQPPVRLETGIFLGGYGAFNYYHWLIELLPKLEFLPQLPEFDAYPLLVSSQSVRSPGFRESLDALRGSRPILELDPHSSYLAEHLLWITTPNQAPFNLRPGSAWRVADFVFRPGCISFIREAMLNRVAGLPGNTPRRIFLARDRRSRSYNQDAAISACARWGAQPVHLEQMSWTEQMRQSQARS